MLWSPWGSHLSPLALMGDSKERRESGIPFPGGSPHPVDRWPRPPAWDVPGTEGMDQGPQRSPAGSPTRAASQPGQGRGTKAGAQPFGPAGVSRPALCPLFKDSCSSPYARRRRRHAPRHAVGDEVTGGLCQRHWLLPEGGSEHPRPGHVEWLLERTHLVFTFFRN